MPDLPDFPTSDEEQAPDRRDIIDRILGEGPGADTA